jgi:hypothetical protein
MKHILNFMILFMGTIAQHSRAQEIIASGGDHFDSANGSLSWTLGEPVVETFGNGYILTQGFQQNYEIILTLQEISEASMFDVYPNPFQHSINISGTDHLPSGSTAFMKIFDNSSRIVYQGQLEKVILLEHLPAGTYFLNVEMNSGEYHVFRLIKSNSAQL